MVLPESGPLSLADIAGEFGGSAPHSLSEYYAGGSFVPSGTEGINGPIPSSGAISISDFYGATAADPYDELVESYIGYYYIGNQWVEPDNIIAEKFGNGGGGTGGLLPYDNATINNAVITRPVANPFASRFPSEPENFEFSSFSTKPLLRGGELAFTNDNCVSFGYVSSTTPGLGEGLVAIYNPIGGTASQAGWSFSANFSGQQRIYVNQAGTSNTTFTAIGPTPFPTFPAGGHITVRVGGTLRAMMINGVYYSATATVAHTAFSSANLRMEGEGVAGTQFHRCAFIDRGLSQSQMTDLYNAWIGTTAAALSPVDVMTLGIDEFDSSTWPDEPLPHGVQLTNIPVWLQTYWDTGIKP